jgi:hypothetical protein
MRTELLRRLFAATDSVPRGRSELLAIAGVAQNEWRSLITELISAGYVEQLGDRRAAEYVRVAEGDSLGSAELKSGDAASKWREREPTSNGLYLQLLAGMDDVPRSRAELTARSGIGPEQWPGAIWHLMRSGDVHKVGDKGGARYFRVGPAVREDADYQMRDSTSAVRFSAHKDVEDVLRELGLFEDLDSTTGAEPIERCASEVPFHRVDADSAMELSRQSTSDSRGWLPKLGVSAKQMVADAAPKAQELPSLFSRASEDLERLQITSGPPPLPFPAFTGEPARRDGLSQPHGSAAFSAQLANLVDIGPNVQYIPPPLPHAVQTHTPHEVQVARWDPNSDTPPPLPRTSNLRDTGPQKVTVQPNQFCVACPSRLGHEVIDKRSAGGCLWIIDTPSASEYVKWLNRGGARFIYASGGGRATDFRAAWWTKDPNVVLYPVSIDYMGAHVMVYSMLHGPSPVTKDAGKIKLLIDAEVLLPGPVIWRPERPIPVPRTSADTAADVPALAHAVAVFLSYLVHPFDRSASVNSWAPEMKVYLAACEHFGFAVQRSRELVGTGSADFSADALLASTWAGAWSSR